jgi:hypothetical protein
MERCKKICEKQQRNVNHMYKRIGTHPTDRNAYFYCMKTQCNPGCKGTLFEEGAHWFSHMKAALQQMKMLKTGTRNKTKNKKRLNNVMNSITNQFLFEEWHRNRNEIMKESSGKLLNKNSFYRTMKKHPSKNKNIELSVYKNQMKKQGVMSGCYRYIGHPKW